MSRENKDIDLSRKVRSGEEGSRRPERPDEEFKGQDQGLATAFGRRAERRASKSIRNLAAALLQPRDTGLDLLQLGAAGREVGGELGHLGLYSIALLLRRQGIDGERWETLPQVLDRVDQLVTFRSDRADLGPRRTQWSPAADASAARAACSRRSAFARSREIPTDSAVSDASVSGSRPRAPCDQRYASAYLFGAVCPAWPQASSAHRSIGTVWPRRGQRAGTDGRSRSTDG